MSFNLSLTLILSIAIVVVSGCCTTSNCFSPSAAVSQQPSRDLEQQVLSRVNFYRQAVGLTPVSLDTLLSAHCREHTQYMMLNRGTEAVAGLNAHNQRPELPGASRNGAECGKAADLFPGVRNLEYAVDVWMAGIYHRRPILDPKLERVGVGYTQLPDGSYMAALMFVNGAPPQSAPVSPVSYPADGQHEVPLEVGAEYPNPVPGGGPAGYPITLQFPPFDKVTGVSAQLFDAQGREVPFYLSDPEHPATFFGQYGIVSLIPKKVLQPRTTYTVSISATWNDARIHRSWSFTTLARKR